MLSAFLQTRQMTGNNVFIERLEAIKALEASLRLTCRTPYPKANSSFFKIWTVKPDDLFNNNYFSNEAFLSESTVNWILSGKSSGRHLMQEKEIDQFLKELKCGAGLVDTNCSIGMARFRVVIDEEITEDAGIEFYRPEISSLQFHNNSLCEIPILKETEVVRIKVECYYTESKWFPHQPSYMEYLNTMKDVRASMRPEISAIAPPNCILGDVRSIRNSFNFPYSSRLPNMIYKLVYPHADLIIVNEAGDCFIKSQRELDGNLASNSTLFIPRKSIYSLMTQDKYFSLYSALSPLT